MKYSTVVLALVFVLASIGLPACKNSTSPNSGGNSAPLTATVNGQPWKALVTSISHPQGILDLSGTSDSSTTMDIQLSPSIADTGTYPIDDSLAGGIYWVGQKSYTSVRKSGSVHLSVWTSTHATGTFSFNAKSTQGDSVVVTNGEFNFTLY